LGGAGSPPTISFYPADNLLRFALNTRPTERRAANKAKKAQKKRPTARPLSNQIPNVDADYCELM